MNYRTFHDEVVKHTVDIEGGQQEPRPQTPQNVPEIN